MSWQEFIVWILVGICIAYVARSAYRLFRSIKRGDENPCANCTGDCKLRKNKKNIAENS